MPRPKSFNRDQALQDAMLVFWKHGYVATSMKQLESATGLTPGSIYHEFGSKLDLFESSLGFYVQAVMIYRVEKYLVESDDPLAGVREFIVSAFKDVPKFVAGDACLLVNTASELGKTEPTISRVIKRGFGAIEKGLYQQLERAKESQQVRPDLNCKQAAQQLVFLMSGLLVASRNSNSTKALEASVDFTLESFK